MPIGTSLSPTQQRIVRHVMGEHARRLVKAGTDSPMLKQCEALGNGATQALVDYFNGVQPAPCLADTMVAADFAANAILTCALEQAHKLDPTLYDEAEVEAHADEAARKFDALHQQYNAEPGTPTPPVPPPPPPGFIPGFMPPPPPRPRFNTDSL